jgi:hypothetical protein
MTRISICRSRQGVESGKHAPRFLIAATARPGILAFWIVAASRGADEAIE